MSNENNGKTETPASGGYRSPAMPTPATDGSAEIRFSVAAEEALRRAAVAGANDRDALRAHIAAAVFVERLGRSSGAAQGEDNRRNYAAAEAVRDADALLKALGR